MKHKQTMNVDSVAFITSTNYKAPGVTLHGGTSGLLTKKVSEVKDDWNLMLNQVSIIIADTDKKVVQTGFQLNEIQIELGFHATGKLAFITEAGVEASISLTFKRSD